MFCVCVLCAEIGDDGWEQVKAKTKSAKDQARAAARQAQASTSSGNVTRRPDAQSLIKPGNAAQTARVQSALNPAKQQPQRNLEFNREYYKVSRVSLRLPSYPPGPCQQHVGHQGLEFNGSHRCGVHWLRLQQFIKVARNAQGDTVSMVQAPSSPPAWPRLGWRWCSSAAGHTLWAAYIHSGPSGQKGQHQLGSTPSWWHDAVLGPKAHLRPRLAAFHSMRRACPFACRLFDSTRQM